jgi:drug/metabolite transporter (DMT)-like permease
MRKASIVRLVLLALLWGSNFLLIKVSLRGFSPAQLLLVRLALGALVLMAAVLASRVQLPRTLVTWGHLGVAAITANVIPYFLFGWAEERVDSSIAGVFNASTPLFTFVIALATRTESRAGLQRVAGLVVGFLGAAVVLAPWRAATPSHTAGQLACLLASASYGVSYVYMRRFLATRGFSALALATSQLTAATVLTAAAAPFVAAAPVRLESAAVVSLITLGLLGTGVAYILNYRLIADEGATAASTVTYLLPVVAVVMGAVVLNEPATWTLLLGTVLILLGVAMAEGRTGRGRAVPEAAITPDERVSAGEEGEREP